MNISEYLQTGIATHYCSIKSSDKGEYINVQNNLIITSNLGEVILVDKPVDVYGFLTSRIAHSVSIKSIINFDGAVEMNYNSIVQGSFIRKHIIDDSMPSINSLHINGYVMNNGVLS